MKLLDWLGRWEFYAASIVFFVWGLLFEFDAVAKPLYLCASAMFYGLHEYRRKEK